MAAEVDQLNLREALRLAGERSERLQAKLEEERALVGPGEQRGPAWWRWLGGG